MVVDSAIAVGLCVGDSAEGDTGEKDRQTHSTGRERERGVEKVRRLRSIG
jgi:hypothetical protein